MICSTCSSAARSRPRTSICPRSTRCSRPSGRRDNASTAIDFEDLAMTPSDTKATLSFSDGSPSMELPLYKGTVGPDVIDIRKLYAQTGKFTYDPGFLSTAACNSTITYIDGDKGELLYRGYPIEQLAVRCDYLETCYLLLNGELPNATQKADFNRLVT